jgi:RNA polymerase-interacting CarD/CdnL/TRCF family regulator
VGTLGELRLAVDDLVVYASHGVGRVAIRQQETVVLEFAEGGLLVTLPIDRAVECVRPVSTEIEIATIGRTLGEADTVGEENWQRRLKTTRGKVTGGEAASLAEVIRDAGRREECATARQEPRRLSPTERELYVKARKLLADEIGASRDVDPSAADEWIGDQLARNGDREPSQETRGSATTSVAPPIETTPRPSGNRARRRRH